MLKGVGGNGFSQLTQVLLRLFEVPVFLYFWGSQSYGEWLILAAIPTYFSLSDLAFTGVSNRELVMKAGEKNTQLNLNIYQTGWVISLVISLTLLFFTFGVFTFFPASELLVTTFSFTNFSASEVEAVILILVLHVVVGSQILVLNGAYTSEGHYGEIAFLSALSVWFEFALLCLVLFLGGGPIEASLAYLSGRVIGYFLILIKLPSRNNWARYGVKEATYSQFQRIFPLTISALSFPIGNALNSQGMRLVVGIILNPGSVAIFTTLLTLARSSIGLITLISKVIIPELGLAYGKKNIKLFQVLSRKASKLSIWIAFVVCFALGVTAEHVFLYWTAGRIHFNANLFNLFLASVFFSATWKSLISTIHAANLHRNVARKYVFIYGVLTILLGYFMTNAFSLIGAGFVLLFIEITMTIYIVRETMKVTHDKWNEWGRYIISLPKKY